MTISSEKGIKDLNQHIADNKHVFVLVFMEKCGPCIQTRPEWAKINTSNKPDNVVIADVNSQILNESGDPGAKAPSISHLGNVSGYPTIKYINNGVAQDFDGPDRSVGSFEKWIQDSVHSSSARRLARKTIKNKNKNKKRRKTSGGKRRRKTSGVKRRKIYSHRRSI